VISKSKRTFDARTERNMAPPVAKPLRRLSA